VSELISTLDVKERARAKDSRGKEVETSTANMVQKKNSFGFRKNKKKNNNKQENNSKPKQTAEFKKKNNNNKKGGYFVCGSDEHWASSYPDHKFKQDKKSANMETTETGGGTSGLAGLEPC
jgi:hypothetical protein